MRKLNVDRYPMLRVVALLISAAPGAEAQRQRENLGRGVEVIWRTSNNKELRIYTTTIPAERRLPTLMHDPVYRLGVAWQNVAYNQPAHTGFYLGEGMKEPPAAK
jgi:hypothetical protein